ncbi:FtsW/RodA/SpoVE family cell cycle protein [Cellulomonas sp. PhB143]|uniref:FtsW/RodA/SpoVE family cell cycle protein n=1 Tax=Cellulomonas sp. PhB143 TaxID=2485186 RepID=UPI000F47A9D6|nr:putative peptidoglycan glycosyltransferase FtsW [Cellulomonas sp. PhB143]ROS77212.1 cell division-specific peptidoglycan biosynthesis regulator FtsW [Cellulomonas sp. PhB143]
MAQATTTSPGRTPTAHGWRATWDGAVTSYYLVIGSSSILLLLGLVMVLSSSSVTSIVHDGSAYAEFLPQLIYAGIGLVGLLLASRLPVGFYRRWAWGFLLLAFVLQAAIHTPLGLAAGGNTGWIGYGPVTIQPSEILKLALAVWLGSVLGRKHRLLGQWRHALVPSLPGALVAVGLVMSGNDLGTSMVLMLVVAGAYWVAGVDWRLLASGAGAAVLAVLLLFVRGNGNRTDRILAAYGPCTDTEGSCYQSLHGTWGLGTGGWLGVGLGSSREKWSYLPAAHNDFIFSVLGEELGLLGTLVVLVLYAVLGLGMMRIIRRHPDPFVKITTAAIACWIVGQALLNIGVVIGILPVIGVPLPLMSAGGSALVATMVALGVVVSFARDEPGTREALAARPGVARRTFSVMAGAARQVRLRRGD